jgi:hypothetical protein
MSRKRTRMLVSAPLLSMREQVGVLRVERTLRWLRAADIDTVVAAADPKERVEEHEGGCTVWIRSPAELLLAGPQAPEMHPKLAALRRRWRELRHVPDPGAPWARRAAGHPLLVPRLEGIRWAWSSSPPESAHLLPFLLSARGPMRHIVDLRDGWLDEPLRPSLQRYPWRRWLEGRVERRILQSAYAVVVTSEIWRRKLQARMGTLACPVHVLPNAMPELGAPSPPPEPAKGLRLIHTGTFSLSSNRRRIELLLDPLLNTAKESPERVQLDLIGTLQPPERRALETYRGGFESHGWSLRSLPARPREELWDELRNAHGLLLLSASEGAIPGKFFEYLALGRPILGICPRGSAVWELGDSLPQLHRLDIEAPMAPARAKVAEFLALCRSAREPFHPPTAFSEATLGRRFLREVLQLEDDEH